MDIKKLKNTRMIISTDKDYLIKANHKYESKNRGEETEILIFKINPELEHKPDTIVIRNEDEIIQVIPNKDFTMMMEKEYDYFKGDTKKLTIVNNNSESLLFFNNKYIELTNDKNNLYISIVSESDDLQSLANGEDVILPRINSEIKYDNNIAEAKLSLLYNPEYQPLEIIRIYDDDLLSITYRVKKIFSILSENIASLNKILFGKNVVLYMDGKLFTIAAVNDVENVILNKFEVYDNNLELIQQSYNLIEILERANLVYELQYTENVIYNYYIIDIIKQEILGNIFKNTFFIQDFIKYSERCIYFMNSFEILSEELIYEYISEIDNYFNEIESNYGNFDEEYRFNNSSLINSIILNNGSIIHPQSVISTLKMTKEKLIELLQQEEPNDDTEE